MPSPDPTSAASYLYESMDAGHMHRHIVPPIMRAVERLKPRRVLDYGCGNGALCRVLKQHGIAEIVGMDPSESGIQQAAQGGPGIRFLNHSVYDPLPAEFHGSFDLIISTEVVEHLYAPRALPRRFLEGLKPGGTVLVTTPYHGYLKNLAIALLNKWDSHHSVFWDHGHIKFWSRKTLRQIFEDAGFEYAGFQGLGRCPWLWMTMLMEFRLKP